MAHLVELILGRKSKLLGMGCNRNALACSFRKNKYMGGGLLLTGEGIFMSLLLPQEFYTYGI